MNRIAALGIVIAELRTSLELTQSQLAERAGVHVNSVSLAERGVTRVSVGTLFALGDALGMSASALLAEAEARASKREVPNRRPGPKRA